MKNSKFGDVDSDGCTTKAHTQQQHQQQKKETDRQRDREGSIRNDICCFRQCLRFDFLCGIKLNKCCASLNCDHKNQTNNKENKYTKNDPINRNASTILSHFAYFCVKFFRTQIKTPAKLYVSLFCLA